MGDSGNEVLINGRPLSALRLVELKEELQKRGLPRSGNKTQLIEKLKKEIELRVSNPNHVNRPNESIKRFLISSESAQFSVTSSNGNGIEHDASEEDEIEYEEDEDEENEHKDEANQVLVENKEEEQQNEDKAYGLPEQAIDFEGESVPNRLEVLEMASEFVAQRSSSSLEVNVDLNEHRSLEVDEITLDEETVRKQLKGVYEDEEQTLDTTSNQNDHDSSYANNEATSTTIENEQQTSEPLVDNEIEPKSSEVQAKAEPESSRKRKWTSPVSLRSGFFKGISLESLNILNLRKSTSQPSSAVNSIVPSEVNSEANSEANSENASEINSESNSAEASDNEELEAPAKKVKLDSDELDESVDQPDKGLLAKSELPILNGSEGQYPAYNPFSLPRLRGFFSRILNRVF